ncbi:uncharacterized protein LOC121735391 [Aricia agestis]|uniref:uncharacterized protein LOC121735391 n=1 Tax=Aricia agestis TaxID=91739 RepID=UPI001C20162F|nr:uncharacterized protein LOC121735391 [Aricia agestis]
MARLLNLEISPTSTVLKGFSGGFVTSQGEVTFELEVDAIPLKCTAHLANVDMQGINLLIGQPVINGNGMSLVISNGTATLKQEEDIDFTKHINTIQERERFPVICAEDECLQPGTSIIKVKIVGNGDTNDVVTTPRHFELQGVSYSLPATLLRGADGYMKVVNTGTSNITWRQGEVLTRADNHEPQSEPQPNIQDGRV